VRNLVVTLCLSLLAGSVGADEKIIFNRDIRPILADHCFQCHGPDEKQRQSELRLDLAEFAMQPAGSGDRAIVPGDAGASLLVHRIRANDPDDRMPPADFGKPLTPAQIELLDRWIREGAEYQGHWAFIPPVQAVLPDIDSPDRAHNEIDRFVLAKLHANGFTYQPEASREILLRRVTFDLTGLPPTLDELDAFLSDTSGDAYEKVVNRLLMSPRYGEQMAAQWLDLARYADSNGYQVDSSRFQWPWRDWVIDAFNKNMPFDQFTIEQLAGDLLPDATLAQKIATGFNRNHRLNGEGGIIAEEWRVETVIDRVETTGLTWLGLTFNCCRCHDHKYDPISQREFYSLFSFFNNVAESGTLQGESSNTEPTVQVPSAEQLAKLPEFEQAVDLAEVELQSALESLPQLVAAWEPGFLQQVETTESAWSLIEPASVNSRGAAGLTRQDDGSWLAGGVNPQSDVYVIESPLPAGKWTGLLLECFPDASLPNQSLGRYPNGNFVLTRVEAEIRAPGLESPVVAKFTKADADYSQPGWDIQFTIGGNRSKGWAVNGPVRRETCRAMFLNETTLDVPAGATITVRLVQETLGQHNIGRFRLSSTGLPREGLALGEVLIPEGLRKILATPLEERTSEEIAQVHAYFRNNVDSPLSQAEAKLADEKKQLTDFQTSWPTVMVMQEIASPREAFVLTRGEYDRRGEPVTAGIPKVFPPFPPGAPNNRLGLARWIVDPGNPLTARVWVNRIWEKFMGTGIVKTTENLGSQADWPSHPELLDWLAVEFMQPARLPAVAGQQPHAWDMKAVQKLIVMSAAYRQSTSHLVEPGLLERDPENRWLGRGPRFRLSAEAVRDQALAVSGLLVDQIGGPSVRPYMPDGVWDETSVYGDLRNYSHDKDNGLYRRTIYTVWKRTAAPPSLLLFDASNREICTVKRSRTNTPLQALSLLNEVTFVEASRKLGERMIREGGETLNERLTYGFRLVTARTPTTAELELLANGWREDFEAFQSDPAAAEQLVQLGESPAGTTDPVELAAYTLTGNVLLNLDECITRE